MKHTFILVWKFIFKKLIALRDSHLYFSVAGRVSFKLLGGTSTKTFSLNWWWIHWPSFDTARGVNWYYSGAGTQVNLKIPTDKVNHLNRSLNHFVKLWKRRKLREHRSCCRTWCASFSTHKNGYWTVPRQHPTIKSGNWRCRVWTKVNTNVA